LVRIFLQNGKNAFCNTNPGKKIPTSPNTAPRTGFDGLESAPRKTAKFFPSQPEFSMESDTKLGPGNAWMIAYQY
jgi:hypothetical protein